MNAKESIYETGISDARWWAYDVPGNAGWIACLVTLVKSMKSGLNAFNTLASVPCGLMLLGVGELVSERIAGLDRVLPKRRLLRGFGALQFEDESFDIVLSLNGFHAFPDKAAAYRETDRVLKKGGTFCGCFYIRGGCRRTDWFVNQLYVPKGFFTPPFETEDSLRRRLHGMYADVTVTAVEGIGCFRCRKA